ncbi:hypothetical protein HYQ46_010929 [Verticillium longisporum]|nr:hypothetical protein HYQ46_010929 [Verticillium longisporum]
MASQTDAESNQMTPRQTVTLGFGKQNHKSCDACRIRKVRCPGPAKPDFGPCATCPDFFSGDSVSKTPSSEGNKHQLPVLHVDSLLTRSSKTSPSEAEDETPPFIRGNGIFAGDLSLTFFSETRLQSLASCLRNNKVNELLLFWKKLGEFDIVPVTILWCFPMAVLTSAGFYRRRHIKHDDWRMSIPDTGFRPGGLNPPSSIHCGVEREAAVMINYYHDGLQLTLARATLHRLSRLSKADDPLIAAQQKATMEAVLSASRSVLERTVLVNVDSHTSIWILAGIPIIGLFVVFDFVIHSPLHVDTPSHLALLDMAGGHFSRIEYRSQGYLPGSLISEFAHIAREYVNDAHQKQEARATQAQTLPEIVNVPQPQQGAAQVQAMANAPKVGPKEGIPSDMDNVASAELPDFSMAFNGFPDYTPSNATTGTDVMGIFNYYLPELDPMFSQGLDEDGSHALGCQRQLSKGRALFVASGWNPGTYVLGFCD